MAAASGNAERYIKQLWPVSILSRRFAQFQQVNPQLVQLFEQYRDAHAGTRSAVYASPDNFSKDIDSPALQHLEQFILDNIFVLARTLNASHWQPGVSLEVKLTGLWFQITNDYGFHDTHVHGNCSWSGVYYVQSGSASRSAADVGKNGLLNGVTRFYGPHTEYLAAGHGDRGNYYLNDNTYDSYPEDGKLVVFPSHLKHSVFPYQGEKDRIIVSFNGIVDTDEALRYHYAFS